MQSVRYPIKTLTCSPLIYDVYYLLSLCCVPLLILFVVHSLRYGTSGNWALDLRLAALGRGRFASEGNYTPLYFSLWQATYLIALLQADKKHWKRAVVMGVLVFSFSIATMAKAVIFSAGIMTTVILYQRGIIRLKHILIILPSIVVVMLILHGIRQAFQYNDKGIADVFELYILGNYAAFDTIQPYTSAHWGENMLRIGYAISYKLGFSSVEPVDPILPFIYKPIFTNTYTCLYPFYKDFGLIGICIGAICTGSLMGWIFRKKQLGSKFFSLLFAYFCPIILIQYNSEFLFLNLAGHIKFCLLLCLPFIINTHIKNES